MDKKRQGNDFGVIWTITKEGINPISSAIDVNVVIVHQRMRTRSIPQFTIEGNVIKFTVPVAMQQIGVHDLVVTFSYPDPAMPSGIGTCTVDLESAFEIVLNTANENAGSTITVSSELVVALHGKSAYELALKYGLTDKTEEEFVNDLTQSSIDAAASAQIAKEAVAKIKNFDCGTV